ncbi:hypothetical protein IKW73_00345 [Candidatus Saccharibacteria bacterium]|nr:hypothetical protein [Candidatus Saccharibacteria bacterium]
MSKNIYDLDVKEMRGLFRDFACTLYGRTVFFIAYFVPFVAFLALIGLVAVSFYDSSLELFYPTLATFFIFITVFMIGNAYYYCEVRKFAEKRK